MFYKPVRTSEIDKHTREHTFVVNDFSQQICHLFGFKDVLVTGYLIGCQNLHSSYL